MPTRTCQICGEFLNPRSNESSICTICEHRTAPQERTIRGRRVLGLLDSA